MTNRRQLLTGAVAGATALAVAEVVPASTTPLKSPPADVVGTVHKTPSPATYTQAFNLASGERVVMHLDADKVIPPDDYFVDETVKLIMQAQKEDVRHSTHVPPPTKP